jgi:hypothetical protein
MSGAAPRIPWPGELPDVIVHHPAVRDAKGRWRQSAFDDPDYGAAKSGDAEAAARYAAAFASPAALQRLLSLLGTRKARVLPVHAEERAGRNAIPDALAAIIALSAGGILDNAIVQANRPFRTKASGLERIARRAWFDGPVERGALYVLVDDHVTIGGTLADLASHVAAGGGIVLAATTLTSARPTAFIGLDRQRLAEVTGRFGPMDDRFAATYGYTFEALTNGEAAILLQQSSLEFD